MSTWPLMMRMRPGAISPAVKSFSPDAKVRHSPNRRMRSISNGSRSGNVCSRRRSMSGWGACAMFFRSFATLSDYIGGFWLGEILPAIGRQGRTRDQAGIVGGKEHDATRDLFRLAQPANRNLRQHVLLQHFLRHRLDHVGRDIAGANGVDGDADARALLRQRLG